MTIQSKLNLLVIIGIVVSIVIGLIGVLNIYFLSKQTTEDYNYGTVALEYANNAESSFNKLRVYLYEASTTTVDKNAADSAKQRAMDQYTAFANTVIAYNLLAQNSPQLVSHRPFVSVLYSNLNNVNAITTNVLNLGAVNSNAEAINVIEKQLKTLYDNTLQGALDSLNTINVTKAKVDADTAATAANMSMLVIIGLLIASAVLLLLVSRAIVKMITTPIAEMMAMADKLANGDFNDKTDITTHDELGRLSQSLNSVGTSMHQIITGLDEMSVEHNKGDIDFFVNDEVFRGSYRVLARNINGMVLTHINTKKKIIACISKMAQGDFDAPMEQLPGKKAFINDALETMRRNLKGVSTEIETMAEKAMAGNLSIKTNESKFEGDWAKTMKELNGLLSSIVVPVMESSKVLQELAKGNLNVKMKGQYQGDLAVLSDSLNTTTTTISSYVADISRVLGELAKSNLNVSMDSEYVGDFSGIKTAINAIIGQLNFIIGDIDSAATQVLGGAKSIADSSVQLSQGSLDQASSLEELTTSIDMISKHTNMTADNAKIAKELSSVSKQNALDGNKEMQNMLLSMESINKASNDISNIIKVIDDIAFQTNLLALNAAVEAARAGTHGKGFAIVADEVRSLAIRSKDAAKETTRLIQGSIDTVSEGSEMAKSTAVHLENIVSDFNKVSGIILDIADSSSEQAASVAQISIGVNRIAHVVHNNSAMSEESSAAAEELSSQAEELSNMIGKFKLK